MDPSPARNRSPPPLPSALIINDGTLGPLVACWAEGIVRPSSARPLARRAGQTHAPTPPLIWIPYDDKPARDRRADAARRQSELCCLSGVSDRQLIRFESPPHAHLPEPVSCGAKTTAMLLAAAVEAAALGIDRVIWPVHVGANHDVDVEALADACDRATLIADLIQLGTGGGGSCCSHDRRARREGARLTIDTPYADFNDAQLMDLALDIDVPLSACWWCLNDDPAPCGHCAACMRWHEALAAVDPTSRLDIRTLATTPATMPRTLVPPTT